MRAHHPALLDHVAAYLRWLLDLFDVAADVLQAFEALFSAPARWLAEHLRDEAGVLDALSALAIQLLSALTAPRPRLA